MFEVRRSKVKIAGNKNVQIVFFVCARVDQITSNQDQNEPSPNPQSTHHQQERRNFFSLDNSLALRVSFISPLFCLSKLPLKCLCIHFLHGAVVECYHIAADAISKTLVQPLTHHCHLLNTWVTGVTHGYDGCVCFHTDVVGVDPSSIEPIDLDATWDMPSGPSRHG